jgi:predicted transcriptional regulator
MEGKIKDSTVAKFEAYLKAKKPVAVSVSNVSNAMGIDKLTLKKIVEEFVKAGKVKEIKTNRSLYYTWKD